MPSIPRPRNIVWLNLESLRFDAITPETMPKLTAYAARFQIRLNREHWSGANVTQFAIFAELTGLSGYHLHNFAHAHVPSPFLSLLARNGYRLRIAKKHQLNYVGLSTLLPPAAVQQDVARGSRDIEDQRMVDEYLQDRARRNLATPAFDFFAFDATHWPYAYAPNHSVFEPELPITGAKLILGLDVDLNMVRNRYKNACHFADEQIARILNDLEARGDLESSIIVLLGDHGEEFHERGQMGHASVLNDFQARTALWIHLPDIWAPAISSDERTTHLDIVPTILQTLGFGEDVLYTQGQSLLSNRNPRPMLALPGQGVYVPFHRCLVTDQYISRWSQHPLDYVFAGVQRRDGAPVSSEEWLDEAKRFNPEAAEMYELLPDVSQPPRKFSAAALSH